MINSTQDDWRALCAAAAREHDPEKLISLVDQILQTMEDTKRNTAREQPHDSVS